jgi:Asp-tRNA(Asn)/Glu-tRNA(Gln) amidotransferase A subunit family amidase
VSSHELVSESLRRIEALDPELGAVVALRPQALEEARVLDGLIADGEDPGPLAGLPLLVKDVTEVAGMRTTFGSLAMVDAPPADRDAVAVARLRGAGAVVVGKTNTPEFATAGWTANLAFGITRNPWDRSRTPGGSSGGSGAALAAGLAAIATATDGGGSVRIPACYCGLAGLKPTNGVIGRDPIPAWMDLSTQGPLAPSADDLAVLLAVLRGPTPGDPTALPGWATGPPATRSSPLRVLVLDRLWSDEPLPPAAAEPFARAVDRFADVLGVAVERSPLTDPFPGSSMGLDWVRITACEHAHHLGRGWIQLHRDELTDDTGSFLELGLAVSAEDYVTARRRRFGYARALDEHLGDDAILLTPVMTVEACAAEGPGSQSEAGWYVTEAQNLTGHPALSLPAGAFPGGTPFGLQVTAPRFRDDLLLELAARWQEAEPWPLAAPGYEPFGV